MTLPEIPQKDIVTIVLTVAQVQDLLDGKALLYIYPKKKLLIITSELRDMKEDDWPGYGTVVRTLKTNMEDT